MPIYSIPGIEVALLAEGVDRNDTETGYMSEAMPVALLAEGVDRNFALLWLLLVMMPVALLAEGVDRNVTAGITTAAALVALLAEGVDRNKYYLEPVGECARSPSSRRAWIEISS